MLDLAALILFAILPVVFSSPSNFDTVDDNVSTVDFPANVPFNLDVRVSVETSVFVANSGVAFESFDTMPRVFKSATIKLFTSDDFVNPEFFNLYATEPSTVSAPSNF